MNKVGELLSRSLEEARHEHESLCESWRLLESKAQRILGVCTVFLSVALGSAKTLGTAPTVSLLFFHVAVVAVFITLVAALVATVAAKLPFPQTAKPFFDFAEKVEDSTLQCSDDELNRFLGDCVSEWISSNEEFERIIYRKECMLYLSYTTIFLASISVLALTFSIAG